MKYEPLDDVRHCASPENVSYFHYDCDFSRRLLPATPRSDEKVLDAPEGGDGIEFSNPILIFKKIP